MKKILSLMLLTFCLSFVINFFDESKASAEKYVFLGTGYNEGCYCNCYLDTYSVQIKEKNPLSFGCRIYFEPRSDSYIKGREDEHYFYFATYTFNGTIRYSIDEDYDMPPYVLKYDDTILINAYQYVLYNY